ncbi:mandelate racemase/muconate lactonizing enzyme family protein [Natronoglomus mannanivorans]|uniref:Mandelate racemase/muconate lactonizing enzyme family protein n=1 Tax=Natronoglomus mannanivorans TaxID=2979990 RepID=A0AAP3E4C5_9EURY|nr:mandelate racemase/muconate lactonizing enzyme family protein [Halobacteria archaeon AArc-xg1-1]
MEITAVETTPLRVPIGRTVGDSRLSITDVYWIVVELETDEGYTGTGWMGSLGFGPDLLSRFVDSQFREHLLGRNPFALEEIVRDLRRQTIYYGKLGMSAWPRSAIDVALWDIQAQAAGQPLYRFLGGETGRVQAYASSMDATHEVGELAALHGEYVDDGFDAVKTKVGNRSPAEDAERVRTIRDAVGPDVEIFTDANQAWSVNEAIRTVDALDDHGIGWIEEPISQFDIQGHRRLVDRIRPPLATGEMLNRPEQFLPLLESRGIDVVQPDLIRAGGISGLREIATLAHRHNVPFAPHFYYAISAHVASAAPNGKIVEYIPEYDIAPLLENPPTIEDGEVVLPDRPGHGYRIDPAAKDEYGVSFDG